MDFGKLKDISNVDFSLPAESNENKRVLSQKSDKVLEVYVGCPIWATKEWVGKIYPSNAQSKDYLKYYAQQFNSIELNTTHYRVPDTETIEKWKEDVTKDFKFSPKFPQPISHDKKLQGVGLMVKEFCDAIAGLEEHLGTSFLQLPPFFEFKDLHILELFLKSFPKEIPLAVEFRHASWFKNDAFEKTAQILEKYQVSTVITDVAGRRDVLHQRITTDTLIIRFVGNTLHPTDYTRIDAWVEQLKNWFEQGLKTLYFFVHEPDNVLAPDLSVYFIQKLNNVCKLQLKIPQIKQKDIQIKLF
ncbi:MAG: DUF72 domain-containing protein [Raineya sp.]|jgi:uncharacterized protein YecE (DUF72 family)|nr:DUF72 domain-containing protein [Raineya sp.]